MVVVRQTLFYSKDEKRDISGLIKKGVLFTLATSKATLV